MKKRLLYHYLLGACLFMSCTCFFCNPDNHQTVYEEYATLHLPADECYTEIAVHGFRRIYASLNDISYDDYNNPTYFTLTNTELTVNWVKTNPEVLTIHVSENDTGSPRRFDFNIDLGKPKSVEVIIIQSEK